MPKKYLSSDLEKELLKEYEYVIGIDEAGRGPWAGPVAVAGYIFSKETTTYNLITDSKKLTKKQRVIAYKNLNKSDNYVIDLTSNTIIDRIGISNAIENSIEKIIMDIETRYAGDKLFLIDGIFKRKFDTNYNLVKKGDQTYYCIASASILAKVTRDKKMLEYSEIFPKYRFDKHVGYGTKLHLELLNQYGPCEIHRKSFKPIKNF